MPDQAGPLFSEQVAMAEARLGIETSNVILDASLEVLAEDAVVRDLGLERQVATVAKFLLTAASPESVALAAAVAIVRLSGRDTSV